jgi:hypothetical protein
MVRRQSSPEPVRLARATIAFMTMLSVIATFNEVTR